MRVRRKNTLHQPPLEKTDTRNVFFRMRAVRLGLVAKVTPTGLVVAVVVVGRD